MIYRFGDYELDVDMYQLRHSGNPLRIEPQVFAVLACLLENRNRVVTKEQLMDAVWGDRFIGDATLNSRIMAARQAIGDSGKEQRHIQTVHGKGYRFVGDVVVHEAPDRPPPPVDARPSTPILYARTRDGVSIAYQTYGAGDPLVTLPDNVWSHIQLESSLPEVVAWENLLSQGHTLVKYDGRGTGLSDREPPDYSLEARLIDLETVVDVLGLQNMALFAKVSSCPIAIMYAARNPERVSHLVLWCPYATGDEFWSLPEVKAYVRVAEIDWDLLIQTIVRVRGKQAGDQASQDAQLARSSTTQKAAVATMSALQNERFDLTPILPQVKARTLVIHRRDLSAPPLDTGRRVATLIPGAELMIVDGEIASPEIEGGDEIASAINRFLSSEGAAQRAPGTASRGGSAFRTILFTDLVGHTEMMSRLGDERGREVLREHERITREVLAAHSGTEVKTTGDGFMASFGSVARAVECAIALQRAIDERNRGVGAQGPAPLYVRIGLDAGEPIEEDGDLFGATVILASRIAAKAEGGEILVSDTVRGLCSGKGFLFADRGKFVAKGFEEPVSVYEVRWRE